MNASTMAGGVGTAFSEAWAYAEAAASGDVMSRLASPAARAAGPAVSEDLARRTYAEASGEVISRPTLFAIRKTPPTWLARCIERLERLHNLRPNWDSYGAETVIPQSIERARRAIELLGEFDTVEAPTVTAGPDGTVWLCWDDGRRSLDVQVLAEGPFHFSYLSESGSMFEQEGDTDSVDDLAYLLTRLESN